MFVDVTAILPMQQSGLVRVLGIASRQRLPDLPDVPTFEEIGLKDFLSAAWNAIAAPPNTPEAITLRLNKEINAVLEMPEVQASFHKLHLVRIGGTRAYMAEFIAAERRRWESVIRSANVTLE